jgi:hypothetical protein
MLLIFGRFTIHLETPTTQKMRFIKGLQTLQFDGNDNFMSFKLLHLGIGHLFMRQSRL